MIDKTNGFITITGVDERTDISALAKLDAEIGILYSATNKGNRYPRGEWIEEAALNLPNVSLHVCGSAAIDILFMGQLDLQVGDLGEFNRIQVNGSNLTMAFVEHLCNVYPKHTIITQYNINNEYLLNCVSKNHSVLIDNSGGRGQSPDKWEKISTNKCVGFAGGLGPDNLNAELDKIYNVAEHGWWIDMENELREDDWFSIEKATMCVDLFKQWKENNYEKVI